MIETIAAGGIFGEMALLEDRPRGATAVVKTEAKRVPVDRNRFLFMVQRTPYFSRQVPAIVSARLRRLVARGWGRIAPGRASRPAGWSGRRNVAEA